MPNYRYYNDKTSQVAQTLYTNAELEKMIQKFWKIDNASGIYHTGQMCEKDIFSMQNFKHSCKLLEFDY